MIKRQMFSFLILTVLLLNFSLAVTQTLPTNMQTTQNNVNPISTFMQKEVSSNAFKIIGAPEKILYKDLIIYLLSIVVIYLIITDILSSVNLFNKKWIDYTISLIVVLVGVYSGTVYKMIMSITNVKFTSISYYIILLGFGAYLIVRAVLKILRKNRKVSEEKAEERADKIRLLRRVQDIEARTAGI